MAGDGKPTVSHVVFETSHLAKTSESVHGGEVASHIGPDGVVAVVRVSADPIEVAQELERKHGSGTFGRTQRSS